MFLWNHILPLDFHVNFFAQISLIGVITTLEKGVLEVYIQPKIEFGPRLFITCGFGETSKYMMIPLCAPFFLPDFFGQRLVNILKAFLKLAPSALLIK